MRAIFLTLFIFIINNISFAISQLPRKCEICMPSALRKRTIKESEINDFILSGDWGQSNKLNKYWIVYSDRSHNYTYSNPSDNAEIYDTLAFNEQVRIAKIENGYALVYSEYQKGVTYPIISTSAKSRGWIPMKNLLLWDSCPTDEAGIYNKALIVINIDEQKKGYQDLGKRYQNPETKDDPKKLVADMNFYFVMKKADNGLVLLARECKMEGYTHQVLYGWVSTSSFINFNYRIFLEPNWNPIVAESLKGKRVYVYRDGEEATSIVLGRTNNMPNSNLSNMYRLEPQFMRYPLLGNKSNKQYHIIAFVRPDGSSYNPLDTLDYENRSLIAFQGYTDKYSDNGLDYWKPVVLLSSVEFAQLMEKFGPVMAAANTGNRKPYVDAMKELVRSMIPDITPKEMDEKDAKEIMALVEAIPVIPNSLKRRTLIQIMDEKIVSDEEFTTMINDFKIKYWKLKKIRENKYDYSIVCNNTSWYWIPLDDLP